VNARRDGDQAHDQKSDRSRHLQRHRDERADRPSELEPSLEDSECSTTVRSGGITLHDALEVEPAQRGHQIQHAGEHYRAERPAEHRDGKPGAGAHQQRDGEHRLFTHAGPQQ